ncbi:poly(A) RNA polymerase, mitochondrial-like [Daktulosphaira vitifoliae]|uniref:poly(A) RNA polymerase, mitochondrial-like n=1 Tax=Daktulosphaira vitifoliae TaxID=58002 RepID=UPI0021AA9F9E|nr:poly(A) RNA polymerase, mitochondrial-like [Daktulosphaira vitifoliae]
MNTVYFLKYVYNKNIKFVVGHKVSRYKSDIIYSKKFIVYNDLMHFRRKQSKRSILVQVCSENSCSDLYSYCSEFGSVKEMFHYQLSGTNHFVLTEFKDQNSVDLLLNQSAHIEDTNVIAVKSPFLWFRSNTNKKPNIIMNKGIGCSFQTYETMIEPTIKSIKLDTDKSLSNQMIQLLHNIQLNDIGTRLRFLTAMQIENALKGIFPLTKVLPFGSSVNSFGKIGSDIDLVIMNSKLKEKKNSRLIFHGKYMSNNSRTQTQRHIELLGDLLQLFLPGCSKVKRISQAKVPIVKFSQDFIGVECDLSVSNETALYMSELLYILGNFDPRVRPLVFTIKIWAQEVNITNDIPGRWITNFSLTLLVLFYLQQEKIIPSIQHLAKLAGSNDVQITDDGVNCTFLRDITKLSHEPSNKKTLEQLLQGFFEYYASYDFNTNAMSLNYGTTIPKPEYNAMYIVNPLEVNFNVSKNVSLEETERFRIELRNAAWTIDSHIINQKTFKLFDLFRTCETYKQLNKQASFNFQNTLNRLVTVKDLFVNDTPNEHKEIEHQLNNSSKENI